MRYILRDNSLDQIVEVTLKERQVEIDSRYTYIEQTVKDVYINS